MKAIGIICEYHPFHLGHAYQIEALKKRHPEAVCICVLSGAFVQRGEPALLSKYDRAAMAISMGADLVLELPYPWSCAPAELFARGGVSILYQMGADGICFGTEGDSLSTLITASEQICRAEFSLRMQEALAAPDAKKKGFPTIRDDVFKVMLGNDTAEILRTPNNALALSYLCESASLATRFSKTPLIPVAIARTGAAHDAPTTEHTGSLSASALRTLIRKGAIGAACASMPRPAAEILQTAIREGRILTGDPSALVLYHYRTQDPSVLSANAGLGGGMAERISTAAKKATTLDELYTLIAAKQYTHAHLRRTVWHGFFETRLSDMQALPPYTAVLAASARGRTYLRTYAKAQKAASKDRDFTVLSRPAKAKQCALPVQAAHARAMQAEATAAMLYAKPRSEADLYTHAQIQEVTT